MMEADVILVLSPLVLTHRYVNYMRVIEPIPSEEDREGRTRLSVRCVVTSNPA
ncbi:MAG: hypothetical protein ACE5HJ_04535 [Thermoplasmata archaeon]